MLEALKLPEIAALSQRCLNLMVTKCTNKAGDLRSRMRGSKAAWMAFLFRVAVKVGCFHGTKRAFLLLTYILHCHEMTHTVYGTANTISSYTLLCASQKAFIAAN